MSSFIFRTIFVAGTGGGGGGGAASTSGNVGGSGWVAFIPFIPGQYEITIGQGGSSSKQLKIKRGNAEGYECMDCKDFCPMAELNMPEGSSEFTGFKCYSCRNGLSLFILKKREKENE